MSAHDYDVLLAELTRQRAVVAKPDATGAAKHREQAEQLAELEDRLLGQQADLLNIAATLHMRPPPLRPSEETAGVADFDAAITAGHREADSAATAADRALDRARQARFLPAQRTVTRHLAVYGLAVLGATIIQWIVLSTQPLADAAWVFAAAPTVAFAAGYIWCGYADRPRLRPAPVKRRHRPRRMLHAKLGLIICVTVDFAVATWWLLR